MRFRYVSDSFKSHRWAPYTCLLFFGSSLAVMVRFISEGLTRSQKIIENDGKNRNRNSKNEGDKTIQFIPWNVGAILASVCWTGFVLVANHVEGSVHFAGVTLFALFFLLFHYMFDKMIWDLTALDKKDRKVEGLFFLSAIIALSIFAIMIMVADLGEAAGKDVTSERSASAAFEYILLILFVAMNIYAAFVMTFVAKNFMLDTKTRLWIRKLKPMGGDANPPKDTRSSAKNTWVFVEK